MTTDEALPILLIEDDDDDSLLIEKIFRQVQGMRYNVTRAATFEAGLQELASNAYAVCLLDYKLDCHNGLDLLRAASEQGCCVPIIMLTGANDHAVDLASMRAGAADFLIKGSINPALLERAVRFAVERQRNAEALRRAHDELELRVTERTAALNQARQDAEHLYQQAEKSNRLKDEFLATLSHELRTPLNAILGYSELLLADDLTEEERLDYSEVIVRNAKLQASLVDDLLDVSHIITGRLLLAFHPADMLAVTQEALASLNTAAEAKALQLNIIGQRGCLVGGEARRLRQVAWNLVSNAIKFTPHGGCIHVSVSQQDKQVSLQVSDTGEGIEPAFLPFVFERFRQEDGAITRKHGGLGLGLSIVRHFVELHGGTVEAASPGKGAGATFTVSLPRLADSKPMAHAASLRLDIWEKTSPNSH